MPTGQLPLSNALGDGQIITGDFQTQINQLLAYVRSLQNEVAALSNSTIREGAVRGVGTGNDELTTNSNVNTRLGSGSYNFPDPASAADGQVLVKNAAGGYDFKTGFVEEQTPPAGFYDVGVRQVVSSGKQYATVLEGSLSLYLDTQETGVTIGPTGSGMDEIWPILDDVPSYAKGLILEVGYQFNNLDQDNPDPLLDGQSVRLEFYRYDPGNSTPPYGVNEMRLYAVSGGTANITIPYGIVPINPSFSKIFYAAWNGPFDGQVFIKLKGYTY